MQNKSKLLPIFLFTAFISALFVANIPTAKAELSFLEILNFGGRILATKNCTCSFNTIVKVGDPQGGIYTKPWSIVNSLLPITSIYDYGKVDKGHKALGNASIIPLPCYQLVLTLSPPFVKCERDEEYNLVYPIITKIGTDKDIDSN